MINQLFKLSVTAMGFLIIGIVGFWLIAPEVIPEIRQANIDQLQAYVDTRQQSVVEPALASLNAAYDQVPTVDEAVADLITRDQQRQFLTVTQRLLAAAITVVFVGMGGLTVLWVVRRIVQPVAAMNGAVKHPEMKVLRTAKPIMSRPMPNGYQAAQVPNPRQSASFTQSNYTVPHVVQPQPAQPPPAQQTSYAQTVAHAEQTAVQPTVEQRTFIQDTVMQKTMPSTAPLGRRRPAHSDRRPPAESPDQWKKIR